MRRSEIGSVTVSEGPGDVDRRCVRGLAFRPDSLARTMTVATYAAAQLLRVLPRERITRAVGRLCDARLPPLVASRSSTCTSGRTGSTWAQRRARAGPFESFDAFFTRRLREG